MLVMDLKKLRVEGPNGVVEDKRIIILVSLLYFPYPREDFKLLKLDLILKNFNNSIEIRMINYKNFEIKTKS